MRCRNALETTIIVLPKLRYPPKNHPIVPHRDLCKELEAAVRKPVQPTDQQKLLGFVDRAQGPEPDSAAPSKDVLR